MKAEESAASDCKLLAQENGTTDRIENKNRDDVVETDANLGVSSKHTNYRSHSAERTQLSNSAGQFRKKKRKRSIIILQTVPLTASVRASDFCVLCDRGENGFAGPVNGHWVAVSEAAW